MDFNDTKEEADFREEVKTWLKENASKGEKVGGRYDAIDVQEDALSRARDWQAKKAEAGYAAITWPEEFGGLGGTAIQSVIYSQEEAKYNVPTGFFEIGLGMCIPTMMAWATKEQNERFVKPALYGEEVWCQLFSEPSAGSDVAGVRTKAEKDGDDWIINGTKAWCTNGDIANTFLIFARTSDEKKRHLGISAFIVERDTDGFTVGNSLPKTGIRGSQSVELVLDNVKVPNTNILGEEGKGFYVAMDCYDHGRIEIAAQGVGIGQAAIESASKYISQRIAFGQPIMEFQGPQFMLAEVAAEIQASRLLTYWAASLRDQGKDFVSAAAIAKMYATEAGERAALTAIKLGGSAGVAKEYPMERYLRDIQVTKIYEGTNDIQRVTLGKLLYKETKKELGLN